MLWNIEGFERNAHNIAAIVESEQPDFIFLSEPVSSAMLDQAMRTRNVTPVFLLLEKVAA